MNCIDEKSAQIFLNMVPQIGPRRFETLLRVFKGAQNVRSATKGDLCEAAGFPLNIAEAIYSFLHTDEILENELRDIEAQQVRIVVRTDAEYPDALAHIPDPPPVLYVKGRDLTFIKNLIGLVGTRKPTYVGKSAARLLAQDLVRYGMGTVSGCARGIDTEVHAATIAAKGNTIAVLGCGLSVAYPPENKDLLKMISENGSVVSEFCMRTIPDRMHFPRRNRIISGLSLGVIVIEAGLKSGALITARCALDQGREVFAVPGNPFHALSQGSNWLLRQGARPVTSGADIMEDMFEFKNNKTGKAAQNDLFEHTLTDDEKKIVEYIKWEPHYIDELLMISGLPYGVLTQMLLDLHMKGVIKELPGKKYVYTNARCLC
ncbi:MAG: DNA-processing protein DprA [bacterium]